MVDPTTHLTRLEAGRRLYTPAHLHAAKDLLSLGPHDTAFIGTRETTLAAGRRLLRGRTGPVAVLNVASATTPAGVS